jgi:hypothetical protein
MIELSVTGKLRKMELFQNPTMLFLLKFARCENAHNFNLIPESISNPIINWTMICRKENP